MKVLSVKEFTKFVSAKHSKEFNYSGESYDDYFKNIGTFWDFPIDELPMLDEGNEDFCVVRFVEKNGDIEYRLCETEETKTW